MRRTVLIVLLVCLSISLPLMGKSRKKKRGTHEVKIKSTKDGKIQKAIFYLPAKAVLDQKEGKKAKAVPLAVCLHSWFGTHRQKKFLRQYLVECKKRCWAIIHPNFRGPNVRPQACASDLAVQDVIDAVEYACKHGKINRKQIFLVGISGGGHMTLVMASRARKLFAAASAWVPISDLAAWHKQMISAKSRYHRMLEIICGGTPKSSKKADAEYKKRSPVHLLHKAKGMPIDISVGIHDGHNRAPVPVNHSLWAFNVLAKANGKPKQMFTEKQINYITRRRSLPKELAVKARPRKNRLHEVVFRRHAGPVTLTIFRGGHEIDVKTAFRWLTMIRKQIIRREKREKRRSLKGSKEYSPGQRPGYKCPQNNKP